jgi:hypothetical protein
MTRECLRDFESWLLLGRSGMGSLYDPSLLAVAIFEPAHDLVGLGHHRSLQVVELTPKRLASQSRKGLLILGGASQVQRLRAQFGIGTRLESDRTRYTCADNCRCSSSLRPRPACGTLGKSVVGWCGHRYTVYASPFQAGGGAQPAESRTRRMEPTPLLGLLRVYWHQ